MLLTPYPPGIPLLIPGERFNRKIVQFLQFARMFNEQFPGFDTDIHGLVEDERRRQADLFRRLRALALDAGACVPSRLQDAVGSTGFGISGGCC